MLEILNKYSTGEIVSFLVAVAFAIKGVITFYDWGYDRLKRHFGKEKEEENLKEDFKKKYDALFDKLSEGQQELKDAIQKMQKEVNLLIDSDKDDIKAYITEKHHYFCYDLQKIDNYSLDCLERRYSHYIREHGNSFVETLMEDIRKLPRKDT